MDTSHKDEFSMDPLRRKGSSRRVSFADTQEYRHPHTQAEPSFGEPSVSELHASLNRSLNPLISSKPLQDACASMFSLLESKFGLGNGSATEDDVQNLAAEIQELQKRKQLLEQSSLNKSEELEQLQYAVAQQELEYAEEFRQFQEDCKVQRAALAHSRDEQKTACERFSELLGMTVEVEENSVSCQVKMNDKAQSFQVKYEGNLFRYIPGTVDFPADNMVAHEIPNLSRSEYELVMWRLFKGHANN